MDLEQKIRLLPKSPGVYLYKNAEGEVIYVGKAKNLRSRVSSYLLEANQIANRKTGSLMREAVDVDYIQVANEQEALALENNLIKQRKPRFNILLRDDKTYPYVKLTMGDRHPKVFVTRKLRKDGGQYFGPYFPGNLAHRIVDLIHRSFLIPSCKVDLNRYHPRPCLEFYIKRCLGPCVENLTSRESYGEAIRDVQLFLNGKQDELESRITDRMTDAAMNEQFELAARLRDQLVTVHQLQEKQRIASAENEDADVFGYHFDKEMLAVNQFHMREGKIVDKRDFFWEDLPDLLFEAGADTVADTDDLPSREPFSASPELSPTDQSPASTDPSLQPKTLSFRPEDEQLHRSSAVEKPASPPTIDLSLPPHRHELEQSTFPADTSEDRNYDPVPTQSEAEHNAPQAIAYNTLPPTQDFSPAAFFSAFLKQLYLDQPYVPRTIYVPLDFPDRQALAALLTTQGKRKVEILAPQRGDKRSLVDLVGQNAKQSYDTRFRTLAPSKNAISNALQDALNLPETPTRIECFDISHISGAESVASMVVWEHGEMKKADYRKYKIKTVSGNDDFASMREIIHRRYKKLQDEQAPFPSLILIDGGLGQLASAADALAEIGVTLQPLASIAKKEEVIYVHGQEDDPVVLDRRSPVLHLVQRIRDESHRFAITYHRKRREMRDRDSELLSIPGVGDTTRKRLITHFGSVRGIQAATVDALTAVVSAKTAKTIRAYFDTDHASPKAEAALRILQ